MCLSCCLKWYLDEQTFFYEKSSQCKQTEKKSSKCSAFVRVWYSTKRITALIASCFPSSMQCFEIKIITIIMIIKKYSVRILKPGFHWKTRFIEGLKFKTQLRGLYQIDNRSKQFSRQTESNIYVARNKTK